MQKYCRTRTAVVDKHLVQQNGLSGCTRSTVARHSGCKGLANPDHGQSHVILTLVSVDGYKVAVAARDTVTSPECVLHFRRRYTLAGAESSIQATWPILKLQLYRCRLHAAIL